MPSTEQAGVKHSIYIYYKVTPQNEKAVRAAAESLLKAVAATTGIEGRLMCRRDKPDTWMEIYEGVSEPNAFLTTLDKALAGVKFAEVLGPEMRRMTELFRPL